MTITSEFYDNEEIIVGQNPWCDGMNRFKGMRMSGMKRNRTEKCQKVL